MLTRTWRLSRIFWAFVSRPAKKVEVDRHTWLDTVQLVQTRQSCYTIKANSARSEFDFDDGCYTSSVQRLHGHRGATVSSL